MSTKMRILCKECKKILDIRLLIVLGIFTFLFYSIFMEISLYPSGGQNTDSPYDIPFMAKLVKKYGPTLPAADRSVADEVLDGLKDKCNGIIAENGIFQKAGITTFDEMKRKGDEIYEKPEKEWKREEKLFIQEMEELIFADKEFSKMNMEIQQMETIYEFAGTKYGVSQEDADAFIEEMYGENATDMYKKVLRQRCTKEEVSLLHPGVFYIVQQDMRYMALLLLICFTVLMVGYQIRERMRGVLPLYATTHTGRKIFGKQFLAGLISCGFVGIVQLLIYLGIYAKKGLLVFFSCPAWPYSDNSYLLDFAPFGVYMVLYMFLVWLFVMAGLVLAYVIGRKAANYIVGIAISIPACSVAGGLGLWMFGRLFCVDMSDRIVFWEPMILTAWIIFAGILLIIRFRIDKRRDIV